MAKILSYVLCLWCVVAMTPLMAADIVKSTFDNNLPNADWDGWTETPTTNQVTWANPGGNPDGYLRFADSVAGATWLSAPSKFLGSWQSYSTFSWDQKSEGSGSFQNQVLIYGIYNGSQAFAAWWPDSQNGPINWTNYGVSITAPDWGHMAVSVSGPPPEDVWASIISNVTAVEILIDATPNMSDDIEGVDNPTLTPVPEPSTLILLGIGAIGLLGNAWRRRKRTA